ncbi:hypothetical protein EDM59_29270 [Brevibacillus nitrificans]|uniref:Uncharacterized protein n=1 Tax=Brevibacillus nitrificans TaxID=651560 RepID=A0A3M8CSP5_9BACL|nr:hypothetical protein [Brevibacillus nitrificans]RNB78734.1 hypothetical protein EDM59_29270 [Brevibacillus nitrificans]
MSNVYVLKNGKIEAANGIISKDALLFATPKRSIDDFIKQNKEQFKENQASILRGIEESKKR